jgi:hypothetical protein
MKNILSGENDVFLTGIDENWPEEMVSGKIQFL